jgi:hypothetical protein
MPSHNVDLTSSTAFWDTGVFLTELSNSNHLPARLALTPGEIKAVHKNPEALFAKAQANAPETLEEGTYRGTQLALTKVYQLIEKSYEVCRPPASIRERFADPSV